MPRGKTLPPKIDVKNELVSALRRTSVSPGLAGYRPQPHQVLFHSSKKTGRLMTGGNRVGKTVAGAAETVMRMIGEHPCQDVKKPPIKARAIGVDFDNGVNRIIMPEIYRWMPKTFLIDGSWDKSYEKGSRTLTLNNGSTLEFMSYDQDVDKFAGTSRDFIWFDEEPPENIFNENLLRLVDVQGKWIMTMTPLIDMSWTLDRLYEKGQGGIHADFDVFRFESTENKYIDLNILDILTEGMDDEEKEARRKGLYFSYSGAIYNEVLSHRDKDGYTAIIEPVLDTALWGTLRNQWGHFAMLDSGFTNPTAVLLGAFNEEGTIIIYDEYYWSKRTVKEHSEAFKLWWKELKVDDRLQYIVADPSVKQVNIVTGYSTQQEYGANGIYLTPGNNDVTPGINRVYSRFKTGQLKVTQNCEKLIWELHRYRWAKYASQKINDKNNLKETPLKKNDHACDALRYGVVSRPALIGETEIRMQNIINAPVAINPFSNLVERFTEEDRITDEFLGDDW